MNNIIKAINSLNLEEKEKLSKEIKISPRCISLGIIVNSKNQIFLDTGFDNIKNQRFYRPLGGGVNFGEHSSYTVVRELEEEIGEKTKVESFLGTLENIFDFEGVKGHEIVFIYKVAFCDKEVNEIDEVTVLDKGRSSSIAVWRSLEEIKNENAKLFPAGLEELLIKNIVSI